MRGVLQAIGSLLPPPPPGSGGPFALSAPGVLETLIESAGLTTERSFDVPTPYVYADVDTAIRAQAASGPARRAAEHSGDGARRGALAEAIREYTRAADVHLDNVFRVVISRA